MKPPFFWSPPKFGQENGLDFGLEHFHSGLHYSQIFLNFLAPPFENPAYATDHMKTLLVEFFNTSLFYVRVLKSFFINYKDVLRPKGLRDAHFQMHVFFKGNQ